MTPNGERGNDPRLRIIEFVGTMSGLLAVVVGFEKILPEQDLYLLVALFVGLVIDGVLLFGAIVTGLPRKNIRGISRLFSAIFSMLVAIAFYGAVVGFLGVTTTGLELVYAIIAFLGIAFVIYVGMYYSFNRIMDQATPF